jgi:hypothetical protein
VNRGTAFSVNKVCLHWYGTCQGSVYIVNSPSEWCQCDCSSGKYGTAADMDFVVQILMENGADVSARDGKYGRAAVCSASHSTVQLLIQHGANVNAQSGRYDKQLFRLLYMQVAFPLSDLLSRTGLMQVYYCFLIIWFLRILMQILSEKKIESRIGYYTPSKISQCCSCVIFLLKWSKLGISVAVG